VRRSRADAYCAPHPQICATTGFSELTPALQSSVRAAIEEGMASRAPTPPSPPPPPADDEATKAKAKTKTKAKTKGKAKAKATPKRAKRKVMEADAADAAEEVPVAPRKQKKSSRA